IRHSAAGAPYLVAKHTRASVINGGDGAHEHPTQALLDLLTIKEMKGSISALKVSIIGDISQSRVARSNIAALVKMGASVTVCGPLTMIPIDITKLGISVTSDITEAIMDADVIMMLRIQLERQQKNTFPSAREYSRIFGLNMDTLKHIKKEVTIMHPGPINRGIEIAPEVADGPFSVILNQVENGVAIRMALLYLLIGGVD
ncbi:MAG: aspartate carbamoyltransferase, partial [Thermodesulfobacteriota bacterium]|nr:aspartate carbamoyltransferase [Thermodesulfobacteriota bacterium]